MKKSLSDFKTKLNDFGKRRVNLWQAIAIGATCLATGVAVGAVSYYAISANENTSYSEDGMRSLSNLWLSSLEKNAQIEDLNKQISSLETEIETLKVSSTQEIELTNAELANKQNELEALQAQKSILENDLNKISAKLRLFNDLIAYRYGFEMKEATDYFVLSNIYNPLEKIAIPYAKYSPLSRLEINDIVTQITSRLNPKMNEQILEAFVIVTNAINAYYEDSLDHHDPKYLFIWAVDKSGALPADNPFSPWTAEDIKYLLRGYQERTKNREEVVGLLYLIIHNHPHTQSVVAYPDSFALVTGGGIEEVQIEYRQFLPLTNSEIIQKLQEFLKLNA